MINGINSGLQSTLQMMQMQRGVDAAGAAQQSAPAGMPQKGAMAAVNVSLQQTAAPSPAEKAMADYRALGQKAVLAASGSSAAKGYEMQDQAAQATQFRQQAFLAMAALRNGS